MLSYNIAVSHKHALTKSAIKSISNANADAVIRRISGVFWYVPLTLSEISWEIYYEIRTLILREGFHVNN